MTITADTTEIAAQFDALAHPVRLRLLHLIAKHGDTMHVDALTRKIGTLTQATITFHLQQMYRAGILTRTKHGLYVYYHLRPEGLSDMQNELDRLLWQHTQAAAKARRV